MESALISSSEEKQEYNMKCKLAATGMRLKSWRAFLLVSIMLFKASIGLLQNAQAQNEQPQANKTDSRDSQVSIEVRKFLTCQWDAFSLEQGISLLQNRKESIESRKLVIDKLRSKRRELDPESLQRVLNQVILIAKDTTESPEISAEAIRSMASLIGLMEEKGQIMKSEVKQDISFLIEVARDQKQDIKLRGTAIRALGDLQIQEARLLLRELLADQSNLNRPEIARNACISIWRLEGKEAVVPISEVLSRTEDPSIFGTAAFSLGQIKTVESMVNLVKNSDRFPDSASCDAVLVDMEEIILEVLKNPQDESLIYAIHATHHLWREGQRERYVPQLRMLLPTAPLLARKAALDRLLEVVSTLKLDDEKRELEPILIAIVNQPELNQYTERIRKRMLAVELKPTDKTILVPSIPQGNK